MNQKTFSVIVSTWLTSFILLTIRKWSRVKSSVSDCIIQCTYTCTCTYMLDDHLWPRSLHMLTYSVYTYKCTYKHTVMRTGHAVSPHFRFLTSSGDWVWMQLEGTLRYKAGTSIPQFWEVKARVLRYTYTCTCIHTMYIDPSYIHLHVHVQCMCTMYMYMYMKVQKVYLLQPIPNLGESHPSAYTGTPI